MKRPRHRLTHDTAQAILSCPKLAEALAKALDVLDSAEVQSLKLRGVKAMVRQGRALLAKAKGP